MPRPPRSTTPGPVSVTIKANGKKLSDRIMLHSVSVTKAINAIPEATFTILEGDPARGDFKTTDSDLLDPGTPIEILAGNSRTEKTIFKGTVMDIGLQITVKDGSALVVTCKHDAFSMAMGRKTAILADTKDSDALSALIGNAGLASDVADTDFVQPELVQFGCSDWDFLVTRAEANGMLVSANDDKITVAPPNFSADAALKIAYGDDILAFDAKVSARDQFETYTTNAWDISNQAVTSASQSHKSQNKWGTLTAKKLAKVAKGAARVASTSSALAPEELQTLSAARQVRAELALITGHVTFTGNASPALNMPLEVANLGKKFSGKGLVCAINHTIADGQWQTQVTLGTQAGWATDTSGVEAPAATGGVAASRGLMIATVIRTAPDPDDQQRVEVSIPQMDGGQATLWARLGLGYATSDAGLMFAPEVGDEVIVGFLNDDPNSPVILGHLHNGQNQPPFEWEHENNTKAIITRSQMKLTFDDDQKIITIETPAGNKVTLDDDARAMTLEDESGSTITMDDDGITLDSSKDIKLSASGKIDIRAGSDLDLRGLNVEAKADAGFSASGSASAELKSPATVTIEGALVNIN